jgi:hypothetical protein
LGLSKFDKPLARVCQYILEVLIGDAHITDKDEKNEACPLVIRLILAGRLAQIDQACSRLVEYQIYISEIAHQAFISGTYSLEDEITAYQRLSNVRVHQGLLESQHALWILA